MKDVTIGEGKLAGKGVYTNRDFKKDEIVIKLPPTRLVDLRTEPTLSIF